MPQKRQKQPIKLDKIKKTRIEGDIENICCSAILSILAISCFDNPSGNTFVNFTLKTPLKNT